MEKKVYESPTVTKVEFDAKDLVVAKKCEVRDNSRLANDSYPGCSD